MTTPCPLSGAFTSRVLYEIYLMSVSSNQPRLIDYLDDLLHLGQYMVYGDLLDIYVDSNLSYWYVHEQPVFRQFCDYGPMAPPSHGPLEPSTDAAPNLSC